MQATILLSLGGDSPSNGTTNTVACLLGLSVSIYMFYQYIIRIKDTPYDPNDWPGAKAWPATMALISFFILAAFAQGTIAFLQS